MDASSTFESWRFGSILQVDKLSQDGVTGEGPWSGRGKIENKCNKTYKDCIKRYINRFKIN